MQQLSGMDASFLYSETPSTPNHISGLYLYDASTAPSGTVSFSTILETIGDRLGRAASFRQRLVRVPLDMDHPYWVQDGAFDLEFHVRHIALPRPGDWRQLCVQTARLHARPLDLTRAPWEITVIDGLDNVDGLTKGSFALMWKTHHAAIDGASGIEILNAVHDLTADPGPLDGPDHWRPEPIPSGLQLTARAALRAVGNPMRAQRALGRMMPSVAPIVRGLRRGVVRLQAPATRFNVPVTAHRVFDGTVVPLADVKQMKSAVPGATVNDAVLSVIGGALRTYLMDKGELLDEPLITMVPISVRSKEQQGTAGNQVSMMVASLATDVADPLARLAAVHASTSESKQLSEAIGARTLVELSELAPGLLVGLGSRASARMTGRMPFNTTITNVPGSPVPLYFCGARMERSFGLGPILNGAGLFHVIASYERDVTISFTACRELLPDPAFYTSCIVGAVEALRAVSMPSAATTTARKRSARRAGSLSSARRR
ncbi:MAG: putative diacylglycerol O-acyltransferase [Ilumatobacteraceae bacterium]|nr:putative diacylglycerol O-acyltransferase [Ilumatobacteraceae bacterium]